jgi:hypothetical protein
MFVYITDIGRRYITEFLVSDLEVVGIDLCTLYEILPYPSKFKSRMRHIPGYKVHYKGTIEENPLFHFETVEELFEYLEELQ